MVFKVELDFRDDHGKAIIAEAEEKEITPEELIEQYFIDNDFLLDDELLDYLDELVEKHGIESELD